MNSKPMIIVVVYTYIFLIFLATNIYNYYGYLYNIIEHF